MSKKDIRKLALKQRDSITGDMRGEMDRLIMEHLTTLPSFKAAQRVLLYASYMSEAGTGAIIEYALGQGKEVVLPKVDENNGTLTKHVINGVQDLKEGYRGIPEPSTDVRVRVEDVDIVVVPGVAFSASGTRIGYGGGYYDRILPRVKGVRPIVALAYEEQIFDTLPWEEHDIGMDIIITPERIIYCDGQG